MKYRRPTSASRVGQDMRNTWSHVVGNLATLVLLALAGCLGYLFWPYLPTLAWAQLVAFSLRGLRDRFSRWADGDDDGERREGAAAAAAARSCRQVSVARLPVRRAREVRSDWSKRSAD